MRIDIYEPQAIWEIGQQPEQQDVLYPRKGETDQSDRVFILCDGKNAHGTTSKAIVDGISGYCKRYQTARGVLTDDKVREAISAGLPTDGSGTPLAAQASLAMICLHSGGITFVTTGKSRIFHIRPTEQKLLFVSREREDAEIADPSIVHVTDIQAGDYFVLCSDGILEKMKEEDFCAFFSAEGSDDRKRNMLRASTAENSDNHSAIFFKIRGVVAESGDELLEDDERSSAENALSGRPAPIHKPKPIIAAPKKSKNGAEAEEKKDFKVVKPLDEPKPKPEYRRQRPIPGTYDEERHSNMKIIILVALILILAIAAGALWYFNSPSSSTIPADSTDVEPTAVTDTTSTQTTEPADSAMLPDSAIAEPEPATKPAVPNRHRSYEDYSTNEYEEETTTPSEEENISTESEGEPKAETKSETSKPAASETHKTEPASSSSTEVE